MKENTRKKILFFSNLYPLPWEPMRGQFNLQQTSHMEDSADISYLIPVSFITYITQVLIKRRKNIQSNYCMFPFFYIPKVGRSLHPIFMLLSMIISVKPIYWFAKHKYVLASWAYPEGVVAAILKKAFKFQLTIDCLGSDINVHSASNIRKKQLASAFKYANTVTTKSQNLASIVKNIAPKANVKTIYNGVNFELFTLNKKPDRNKLKLKLLFIGNLIKTKGVFELLEAAIILKQEKINFEISLIGNGPEKNSLKALISKHKLSDQVKLIGGVPHKELNEKLSQVHALILPSYREGVPNVIMEALASGTPVIATKVGGIPEVVINKVNGILLDNYKPETIVNGIKQFMGEEWPSKEVLETINGFSWANTSEQFLSTFQ